MSLSDTVKEHNENKNYVCKTLFVELALTSVMDGVETKGNETQIDGQ